MDGRIKREPSEGEGSLDHIPLKLENLPIKLENNRLGRSDEASALDEADASLS